MPGIDRFEIEHAGSGRNVGTLGCEGELTQQLAVESSRLAAAARDGSLTPDDLVGGTFTVSALGMFGVDAFTPIINSPEVAILGVNQIHDRPMVIDGEIVARKMMYLSPSFDHRVIDGAVAARFVSEVKALLESPNRLLLEAV